MDIVVTACHKRGADTVDAFAGLASVRMKARSHPAKESNRSRAAARQVQFSDHEADSERPTRSALSVVSQPGFSLQEQLLAGSNPVTMWRFTPMSAAESGGPSTSNSITILLPRLARSIGCGAVVRRKVEPSLPRLFSANGCFRPVRTSLSSVPDARLLSLP